MSRETPDADDRRWMRRAIELAGQKMQAGHGGPFGAVVVRDGELIAEGFNQVTSTDDPTAHAEIVAIRRACRKLGTFKLTGCRLYTSCEPCPMCLAAIYWARIERVYYAATRADAEEVGFDDRHFYEELARPLGEREMPEVPLLRDEARTMMAGWLKKDDRVEY